MFDGRFPWGNLLMSYGLLWVKTQDPRILVSIHFLPLELGHSAVENSFWSNHFASKISAPRMQHLIDLGGEGGIAHLGQNALKNSDRWTGIIDIIPDKHMALGQTLRYEVRFWRWLPPSVFILKGLSWVFLTNQGEVQLPGYASDSLAPPEPAPDLEIAPEGRNARKKAQVFAVFLANKMFSL